MTEGHWFITARISEELTMGPGKKSRETLCDLEHSHQDIAFLVCTTGLGSATKTWLTILEPSKFCLTAFLTFFSLWIHGIFQNNPPANFENFLSVPKHTSVCSNEPFVLKSLIHLIWSSSIFKFSLRHDCHWSSSYPHLRKGMEFLSIHG